MMTQKQHVFGPLSMGSVKMEVRATTTQHNTSVRWVMMMMMMMMMYPPQQQDSSKTQTDTKTRTGEKKKLLLFLLLLSQVSLSISNRDSSEKDPESDVVESHQTKNEHEKRNTTKCQKSTHL